MLHVVLVEPEIPPNCGNIARTCAATGSALHLVEPLGFDVSDRAVKRAGLDYWHLVDVTVHPSLEALFAAHPEAGTELWLATTKAPRDYGQVRFSPDCWLFFGKETAGLPRAFRERHRDRCIRIPMAEEPQPVQFRRDPPLRSPAAERVPRTAGDGRDGRCPRDPKPPIKPIE